MNSDSLATQIDGLPEESRRVVLALLNLLARKPGNDSPLNSRHAFAFDWEGGFSGAFDGVASVDLQHEANKWR
jgi:hypothetical protein